MMATTKRKVQGLPVFGFLFLSIGITIAVYGHAWWFAVLGVCVLWCSIADEIISAIHRAGGIYKDERD